MIKHPNLHTKYKHELTQLMQQSSTTMQ